MSTPIELHFYNKKNEVIKTYSQSIIKWNFFKRAVKLGDRIRPRFLRKTILCKAAEKAYRCRTAACRNRSNCYESYNNDGKRGH